MQGKFSVNEISPSSLMFTGISPNPLMVIEISLSSLTVTEISSSPLMVTGLFSSHLMVSILLNLLGAGNAGQWQSVLTCVAVRVGPSKFLCHCSFTSILLHSDFIRMVGVSAHSPVWSLMPQSCGI